jgi:peroxiredoxin
MGLFGAILLAGCVSTEPRREGASMTRQRGPGRVPDGAASTHPIRVGYALPRLVLRTPQGRRFQVRGDTGRVPLLLISYRGGWCPYCNRHLADLQNAEQEFTRLGIRILAISPDRPEELQRTHQRHGMAYQLLSDSSMVGARRLGLAFQVDDKTFKHYRKDYGIDLEKSSGERHHQLPVPAAILVDRRGIVRFVHADPDYRHRIDMRTLLDRAREVAR